MSCPSCSTGTEVPTAPTFPMFPPPVGSSTSPSSTPVVNACEGIPLSVKVKTDFVAPSIGSQVQIVSACAFRWAVSGMDIYVAPFGRLSIQNVQDEIITAINRSIPEGRVVVAGTAMIAANGFDFVNASEAVQLMGLDASGYPVAISPVVEGSFMKAVRGVDNIMRWVRATPTIAGMSYYPNLTESVFFTKDSANGNFTLPGHPGSGVPCIPVLIARVGFTIGASASFSKTIKFNGTSVMTVQFSGYTGEESEYVFTSQAAMGTALVPNNPVAIAVENGPYNLDNDTNWITTSKFDLAVVGWYK